MLQTNAYSIFVVLLRTAALWLFCRIVINLPTLANVQADVPVLWVIGVPVVMVLTAVLVWIYADKLARVVMARPNQPVFESDLSFAQWQALAFSAIGLWMAVMGTDDLAFFSVQGWMLRDVVGQGLATWPEDFVANFVATGLQLAIGLALIIGQRRLVAALARWREAGTTPQRD